MNWLLRWCFYKSGNDLIDLEVWWAPGRITEKSPGVTPGFPQLYFDPLWRNIEPRNTVFVEIDKSHGT